MEASRNGFNWFPVVIATIFSLLAGLGLGIVIRNNWEHLGQSISIIYGIAASVFFAIALIIFMYASSVLKK